jgi:hypothetical protein
MFREVFARLTVRLRAHKEDTFVDCWDIGSAMVDTVQVRKAAARDRRRAVFLDTGLDMDLKNGRSERELRLDCCWMVFRHR